MKIENFALVPVEAFGDKRLTLELLRVLGVLLSFRNVDSNRAWPTREAIAERCGMHPSNISKATKKLEQYGWIKKEGRGGLSKPVMITFFNPFLEGRQATVADSATAARSAIPKEARTASRRIAGSATGKEQTIEHTSEQTKRSAHPPKASRLPNDWTLPGEYRQWALDKFGWTPEFCEEVAEKFRDHWLGKAGSNASKNDWFATWRNWCRNEKKTPASAKPTRIALKNPADRNYGEGGKL